MKTAQSTSLGQIATAGDKLSRDPTLDRTRFRETVREIGKARRDTRFMDKLSPSNDEPMLWDRVDDLP